MNPTLVDSILSVQPSGIMETNSRNINDQVSLKDSESGGNDNIKDPIEYVFYNYNHNVPKLPQVTANIRSIQVRKANFRTAIVKYPDSLCNELQTDPLLYNNETCQSVGLYVCLCHSLSRPSVSQLKYQETKIRTIYGGMDEYLHAPLPQV